VVIEQGILKAWFHCSLAVLQGLQLSVACLDLRDGGILCLPCEVEADPFPVGYRDAKPKGDES
jgi:hypothetical protein